MKAVRDGVKAGIRRVLSKLGYRVVSTRRDEADLYRVPSYDESRPLPAGAAEALRAGHPRLLELRERYARVDSPMRRHTVWAQPKLERQLELARFRGDNAYVWQLRNVRSQAPMKYFLFTQYVAAFDDRKLLARLGEDGLFGAWTFDYEGYPTVSRDLLDSINELYFLDRHAGLFGRQDLTVLDIGAGYGRLAHRMTAAVPGVRRYLCVDAIPESTFLCEYYTRFRGCGERVQVVPFDELGSLDAHRPDLAVNIHSFSEMSYDAIAGWFALLARLRVPQLMIVPNDPESFLSVEAQGPRRDFAGLIRDAGYELQAKEPVFRDDNVRKLTGIEDRMFLFRRVT